MRRAMVFLPRVGLVFVLMLCILLDAFLLLPQFRPHGFRPDFGVFWTAARFAASHPGSLYDFDAMTQAQAWLADPSLGSRPFVYPPTGLLLFAPLRLFSFPVAFLLWTALSLLAFRSIVRRLPSGPAPWAVLLAPPVVQALMTGQTTLIVGAMIVRGLSELERRPLVGGLWLGVAAALKPQTLLLLPIAYLRTRQWTALLATGGAGLAMLLASLSFGPALWIDWLHALGRYPEVMAAVGQNLTAISPASAAAMAGMGPVATLVLRLLGAAAGAACVWWAFGRDALDIRLAGLLCGAFLASPYAMPYELAVLAPVAIVMLLRPGPARWLAIAPLTGLGGVTAVLLMVAGLLARPSAGVKRPRGAITPVPQAESRTLQPLH